MNFLDILYLINITWLAVYGYHTLLLTWYRYRVYQAPQEQGLPDDYDFPMVTIQLPIYNERYVVERLINNVAKLDYPKAKLEIQVLDDSTDDTRGIIQQSVGRYQALGFNIEHIQRQERRGYKAGALQHGLDRAKGVFIAIFDADFLPPADFLKKTLAYFENEKIGCVQTRWGHLNRGSSWLTRAQAAGVDGHFVIEQSTRSASGLYLNFNGTGGVWRQACILDAGGWQDDTLTEDLDLSYRAQLKGWHIFYNPHVTTPAELPVDINAFKQQQFRWAKGSIQTARKLLRDLWRSRFSLKIKLAGTLHLTNYLVHPLILANLFLQLLLFPLRNRFLLWFPLLSLAAFGPVFMYWLALKESGKSFLERLSRLIILQILGISMSYNNTRAIFEALFSIGSPFQRTPKFNLKNDERFEQSSDYQLEPDINFWVELCLAVLSLILLGFAIANGVWGTAVWMALYASGYTYISILGFRSKTNG